MSSPVKKDGGLTPQAVDDIMAKSVAMVKRLMNHAENNPIVSVKDVREVRATTKLGLEVVDKATTDPFFMANMVKNMPKDKLATLNDWIHQTKRMGK